jgi:thiamine-phosphate diphosphorylase
MVVLARGSHTRIIVNDRLDVAIGAGAAGVHLRSDSISPKQARTLAPPEFLIGRSVHGADEASQFGSDVDYLVAGTVWATPSKPADHPLLGAAGLATVVRASRVPVLAIGGVTLERMPRVAGAGAAGIAAIGLFMPAVTRADKGSERTAGALHDVASAVRARYGGSVPPQSG